MDQQDGALLRPECCTYMPFSVAHRAMRLKSLTASNLLYLLCELIFTHEQEQFFVDRSYRDLAEVLHRDRSTVARAAKQLRDLGEVEVESLPDGIYRWYVLLEPEDIVSDPEGICRLRKEYRCTENLKISVSAYDTIATEVSD